MTFRIDGRISGSPMVMGTAPLTTGVGGLKSLQMIYDALADKIYIGIGDDGNGNCTSIVTRPGASGYVSSVAGRSGTVTLTHSDLTDWASVMAAYAPLASPAFTGSPVITSSASAAFGVGANGATNPVFQVNAATASVATGLKITGAAAGGKVAIVVISSGTNEALTIDGKGSGNICLNYTGTGNVGIGTNNPSNKFVVSNNNAQGFEVNPSGGPGGGVAFQSYNRATSAYIANGFYASAHTWFSGTGTTRVMDISVAGGVSIGTTTDAGATNLLVAGSILSAGATGVGYTTGAGSSVTQTTSRTTGVTINKPCGAITLASAAGSATWSSFTVSNSVVSANDVVVVAVRLGTNTYSAHVTAIAAGSFQISVAAISGTATDAPVINFAVIKAVIA